MTDGMRLAVPVLGVVGLVAALTTPVRAQGLSGSLPARLAALEASVSTLESKVETLETQNAAQTDALTDLQQHVVDQQSTVASLELAVAALQKRQPAVRLTVGSNSVGNGDPFRWGGSGFGAAVFFDDPGEDSMVPMLDPADDRVIRIPQAGLYFVNVGVQTDQDISERRTLSLRRNGSVLNPCSGGEVLAATHHNTENPPDMTFPSSERTLRLTAAVPLQANDTLVVCHSFNGGAFNRSFIPRAVSSYAEVIYLAPQ